MGNEGKMERGDKYVSRKGESTIRHQDLSVFKMAASQSAAI